MSFKNNSKRNSATPTPSETQRTGNSYISRTSRGESFGISKNISLNTYSTTQRKTIEDFDFILDNDASTMSSSSIKSSNSERKSSSAATAAMSGSDGRLRIAIDKNTGQKFTMKVLNKQTIFKWNSIENLKLQVKIQKRIHHPNISRLHHYFEDKQYVFLILEYAEQGSLFYNLRNAGKFSEEIAFRFFYQTCLAVDCLHKFGIIHRDLKPENLFVDTKGDIKLSDFGWNAGQQELQYQSNHQEGNQLPKNSNNERVDYQSPEVIENKQFNHQIDIWCLGILLYELTHGRTPFENSASNTQSDSAEKLQKIKQTQAITFSQISSDLQDLLLQILKRNPLERISMEGILNHPWMLRFYAKFSIDIKSILINSQSLVSSRSSLVPKTTPSTPGGAESKQATYKQHPSNISSFSNSVNTDQNNIVVPIQLSASSNKLHSMHSASQPQLLLGSRSSHTNHTLDFSFNHDHRGSLHNQHSAKVSLGSSLQELNKFEENVRDSEQLEKFYYRYDNLNGNLSSNSTIHTDRNRYTQTPLRGSYQTEGILDQEDDDREFIEKIKRTSAMNKRNEEINNGQHTRQQKSKEESFFDLNEPTSKRKAKGEEKPEIVVITDKPTKEPQRLNPIKQIKQHSPHSNNNFLRSPSNKPPHSFSARSSARNMNRVNRNKQDYNDPYQNNQQQQQQQQRWNAAPNSNSNNMQGNYGMNNQVTYAAYNSNNGASGGNIGGGLQRQRSKRSPDTQSVSSQSTIVRKTLSDYEFSNELGGGQLGQGSYGTVRLATDRQTKERVAIKIMQKTQIFKYCTVENLKREIKIQKKMVHANICKLFHFFEDKQNVYLVLEYAQKGNLFNVLRKVQRMEEAVAFRYFFQTCLGIDHLHRHNIIHRDLKPENLLVDRESNIKVCDFGWSADGSTNSIRTTFCGTVDYMAPEMVKQVPHDHRIDIWSLGVLLFELTHGYTPFSGSNQSQKLENIMKNKPIMFRSNLEFDLIDLIKNILQPNQQYRLTMDQIFKHPWMQRHYKRFNIDLSTTTAYAQRPPLPQPPQSSERIHTNMTTMMHTTSSSSPTQYGGMQRAVSLDTSTMSSDQSFAVNNMHNNSMSSNNSSFYRSYSQQQHQSNTSRSNRQNSNDSFSEDTEKRKHSRNNQQYQQQYAAQKKYALNRLDEEEEEENLANSAISVNYRNIKRINQQQIQEQDESFFDKILIAFGCLTRDKLKK